MSESLTQACVACLCYTGVIQLPFSSPGTNGRSAAAVTTTSNKRGNSRQVVVLEPSLCTTCKQEQFLAFVSCGARMVVMVVTVMVVRTINYDEGYYIMKKHITNLG